MAILPQGIFQRAIFFERFITRKQVNLWQKQIVDDRLFFFFWNCLLSVYLYLFIVYIHNIWKRYKRQCVKTQKKHRSLLNLKQMCRGLHLI